MLKKKNLGLSLLVALCLLPILCTSQNKKDSLITVKADKYEFFVSYYIKAKSLMQDTAILRADVKDYKSQSFKHKMKEIELSEISKQQGVQIIILQKEINVYANNEIKLIKHNKFLKRFTIVITPIAFLAGGYLGYKLFR